MSNPILNQERVAFLSARDSSGTVAVPAWPRQDKELPLVEVVVEWVRFSTLNHRTRAEQMREIHKANRADLFTSDPLGKEAQEAQYKILTRQEGFAALKEDLKKRRQQEPAIITAEGVLINGNRRAAALRSLYLDDSDLQSHYIKCLVLPQDATIPELVDLEAELQVARDFKQEYSWINEALLIEELYDRENKDFERVRIRMHREVGDLRSFYDKLQQVHQLVSLSNGARLHIDFEANESAFDELSKHIKNKPAVEADSVRGVYFLGTLANVNYRKLRHLRRADASAMVRREIEGDVSLRALMKTVKVSKPVSATDPLDDLLGESPTEEGVNDILSYLAAIKPDGEVTLADGNVVAVHEILGSLQSAINAASYEAEEEQRDQTAVTAPIVRCEKAIAELERALSALPKARAFKDWKEDEFTSKLDVLADFTEKMRAAP
jgi:hypothetical protein